MLFGNFDSFVPFNDHAFISVISHVQLKGGLWWGRSRISGLEIPDTRQSLASLESFGIEVQRSCTDIVRLGDLSIDDGHLRQ